ncbi:hypothetical protein [Rhizobium sp. AAP43]|uniref:hypothetical protein n=1 Tax=Rhizobium sp. AAP43 TaxID=1523420 RepID=UPI0006B971D3|nr:hypothetical protein [Rhizobium sp. AAP43]KPF46400.1 hypothetical protein IP76_05825 [Rhizobium sp. AAP43]
MADFIAVIRRAVDGLSNNTPEMRVRVYEKARAAVVRQLENMQPRPPEHMLQRQLEKLDAAIREVEAEHAAALPAYEEEAPAQEWASEPEPMAPEPAPVEAYVEPVQAAPAPAVTGDDWADAYMAENEPRAPVEAAVPEHQAPVEQFAPWETPAAAEVPPAEPEYTSPVPVGTDFDEGRHPAEPDLPEHYAAPEPVAPAETWPPVTTPAVPLWEHREAVNKPVEPAAAARMDLVDDWLQERQADAAPASLPEATWDVPAATEPAANRVPELPEIGYETTQVSHTPTDEFPAFSEPARIDTSAQFEVQDGYRLPAETATDYAGLAPNPGQLPTEPDDFSRWFQEHAGDVSPQPDQPVGQVGVDPYVTGVSGAMVPDPFDAVPSDAVAVSPKKNEAMDALMGGYDQPAYRLEPQRRRNYAPVILAVVGFTIAAGAGLAGWIYRDDISSLVANVAGAPVPADETATQTPAATTPPANPAEDQTAEAANGGAPAEAAGSEKFTQRLRADGSEVDDGAAAAPSIGTPPEGRSVSAQTVASNIEPTDGATPPAQTSAPAAAAAAAGGDKLFLYEEQIGQATPVAVPGGVTWTALRENGPDGRPDPQIQGRLSVPDRGLTALLTIKRNTDDSLPASHIIEVVFSVPATFEGGAIENLQRIAMKRTEQDRGDPLVAVTAKVTDDTYLVALNDFEDVIARNLELLSTRGWIDIPVIYRNGRRALITMDKGTDGARVFEQVINEWKALGPGN